MTDPAFAAPSLRARLQLRLGASAELAEQRGLARDRVLFNAAPRDGSDPLIVTLFAAPPLGPDAAMLRDRFDRLRQLEHSLLELPVSYGDLDGSAWVVESAPAGATLRERIVRGLMPLDQAVTAFRDVTRTVAAMHRAGLTHGDITVDTVMLLPGGATLSGAAAGIGATVADDLDALGRVGWTLLTGERANLRGRYLSQIRRGVPPRLDALCMALCSPDASARPASAQSLLDALEALPMERHPIGMAAFLAEGGFELRGGPVLAWMLMAAAAAAAAAVLVLQRGR